MRKSGLMMAIMVTLLSLSLLASLPAARAGEKEEVQAKLIAVLQEERAIQAEQNLYQQKFQDNQQRMPQLQKEKQELSQKLKAIEEKEAANKKESDKAKEKPKN